MNWGLTSTILSLLVLLVTAIVELAWSRRYRAAKNAEIHALRAEIESLKEMTPMKVREYYLSTKELLEQCNAELQKELEVARRAESEQSDRIVALKAQGFAREAELVCARAEADSRRSEVERLTAEVETLEPYRSDVWWIVDTISHLPAAEAIASAVAQKLGEPGRQRIYALFLADAEKWKQAKLMAIEREIEKRESREHSGRNQAPDSG